MDTEQPKNFQKRYYEKNREKIIAKTSEYSKKKRAEAREQKSVLASILDIPKAKPSKVSKKPVPLIIEVKTGKFIFDIEW